MNVICGNEMFDLYLICDEVYEKSADYIDCIQIPMDTTLIYVMGERAVVRFLNEEIILRKDQWYVVGAKDSFVLDCTEGNAAVLFHGRTYRDYRYEYIHGDAELFWAQRHADFYALRRALYDVFQTVLSENGMKGCLGQNYKNEFMENQIYRCLDAIAERLEIREGDVRVREMLEYIHKNYADSVSLKDMSVLVRMSISSCSRIFLAETGIHFEEYLKYIRLHHAMVLLAFSNMQIIRVSSETGFSGPTAFNRIFRQFSNMTPGDLRKQMWEHCQDSEEISELKKAIIRVWCEGLVSSERNEIVYHDGGKKRSTSEHVAVSCINVGGLFRLNAADVREMLLKAKKDIGFSMVRVVNVFSNSLKLRKAHEHKIISYAEMDSAFDFLVNNGLDACVELNTFVRYIVGNMRDLICEKSEFPFENFEEKFDVIVDFFKHCVNRYGRKVVSKWKFNYAFKYAVEHQGFEENIPVYIRELGCVVKTLHSILPEVEIGGGDFDLESAFLNRFIPAMALAPREGQPDFISGTYYTYLFDNRKAYWHPYSVVSALDYNEQMRYLKNELKKHFGRELPIYVMEWNLSVCSRNVFNDSVAKAVALASFLLKEQHGANMLTWSMLTDHQARFYDVQGDFFGGQGLFSEMGIPKPVYQVLTFFKNLRLVNMTTFDKALIGRDCWGDYHILCANIALPDIDMFIYDECGMSDEDVKNIFMGKRQQIAIKLKGVENGRYLVQKRWINDDCCNIKQLYQDVSVDNNISLEDINYIQSVGRPRRSAYEAEATAFELSLDADLSGDEVVYYHIKKQR